MKINEVYLASEKEINAGNVVQSSRPKHETDAGFWTMYLRPLNNAGARSQVIEKED